MGFFKAPRTASFLSDVLQQIEPQANQGLYPNFGMWGTVVFTKSILKYDLYKYKTKKYVIFAEEEKPDITLMVSEKEIKDWIVTSEKSH